MRKYKLLLLIFLPLFAVSCDGWLDVKPQDEIDENDLFSSGDGYRHSLNGIYYGMADKSLYGQELTWGIVDALAQCYDFSNTTSAGAGQLDKYGAAGYEWENFRLKPAIEKMWENSYKVVANCNNLIQNIEREDPNKFVFKEREKCMIWGEALALRAFVQLDMVRLFAAAPSSKPEKKVYVPYISKYPSYISNRLPVDSCMNFIIQDLKDACVLLWKADSASAFGVGARFQNNSISDKFFVKDKRGYRLNYYAAKTILARACLYAQKTKEAYTYAKEVIDFQDKTESFKYYTRNIKNGDIKFYYDIIWGIESVDLVEYMNAINELTNPDVWEQNYMQVLNVKESFFQGDIVDGSCRDVRFRNWMVDLGSGTDFRFSKYEKFDAEGNTPAKINNYLVPLVRMSELYYIAAEAIYKTNLDEAKGYLRRVKEGRGLSSGNASMKELNGVSEANKEQFMDILINDARREWLGEGQIFFMYKRLNQGIPAANVGDFIPVDAEHVIVPIPDTETNIN